MDYEKLHKDTIAKLQEMVNSGKITVKTACSICADFVPESEDERIRKEIISYLKRRLKMDPSIPVAIGYWIAWLEKQGKDNMGISEATKKELEDNLNKALEKETPESWNKFLEEQGEQKNWESVKPISEEDKLYLMSDEQKSTNKIEPKFKVGDWIIDDDESVFRVTIDNNKYQLETLEGKLIRSSYKNIEKKFWLWTIQDAKNGDILEFVDHEKVVVGIVSFVNKKTGKVDVSCLLEDNKFKIGNFYALDTINPHPATKEQRDLLFSKMKEAGYELDADKKELMKIEQNCADKIEPKFKVGDVIRHKKQGFTCKITAIDTEYRVSDCCGSHLPFDSQDYYELVEKNPSWSEEDETTKNNISHIIRQYDKISKSENQPCYYVSDCLLWMQNIKERVLPQPKQEWSEEDRKIIIELIGTFESAVDGGNITFPYRLLKDYIRMLKSCMPQTNWRPSKEQIMALRWILNNIPYCKYKEEISGLLDQIKDL